MTTPWSDPNAGPPLNLTPTPEPKKSHSLAWILSIVGAALLILCVIGAVLGVKNTNTHNGNSPLKPTVNVTVDATSDMPTAAPTKAATKAPAGLTKDNVKLTLSTVSKHCYGSGIGCNVEVKVSAAADLTQLGDSSWDVTYSIKGDESGPIIGTLTLSPDMSYTPGDEMLSTSSSGTKPTVTVTKVEKIGF